MELAFELTALLESIGEPALTVALAISPMAMGLITGDMAEMLRLSQMVIDLSDSDPAGVNFFVGAPLAYAYGYGRSLGGHRARRAGATIFTRPDDVAKYRSHVAERRRRGHL